MRVAIVQSNYIPWRGYFDLIDSVDKFVFYDDVQYSKGSWRNRNRIKMPGGLQWISVPVRVHLGMMVDDVEVAQGADDWRDRHRMILTRALGSAPCFSDAMDIWESGISGAERNLSNINVRLSERICRYLGVQTELLRPREFAAEGRRSDRLLDLLAKLGATTYVSGPIARRYLDEAAFRRAGIRIEYKSYDYPVYPQLWGPFEGAVTILDLIANTGPGSRSFLSSRSRNEVVEP